MIPMRKKVLLGMSGGVDSSVAALLLLRAGYEVTGATMRLRPDEYMQKCSAGGCKKVYPIKEQLDEHYLKEHAVGMHWMCQDKK